jgi:hypothetical protein
LANSSNKPWQTGLAVAHPEEMEPITNLDPHAMES